MKNVTKPTSDLMLSGIAVVLITWFAAHPTAATAQGTQGQNAVCSSSSGCSAQAGSSAFVDASMFITKTNPDICSAIYSILQPPTYSAAVIDARGVGGSALTCATGTSPWFQNGTGYVNKPSVILLPSGTIKIPTTWVLPNGTKLIGEETTDPALNNGGTVLQTTIQANGLASGSPMIQFGYSIHCNPCTGISVENLTLDGNVTNVIGIENQNAQDLSYVDHVSLSRIDGTGLYVTGNAQNSGPYSNINFDTLGTGSSASVCAQILSVSGGTHGIHGLSCVSNPESQTAILLDSSNNTRPGGPAFRALCEGWGSLSVVQDQHDGPLFPAGA